MEGIEYVKYPCGLEYYSRLTSGVFGGLTGHMGLDNILPCPLHGKNCSKQVGQQQVKK